MPKANARKRVQDRKRVSKVARKPRRKAVEDQECKQGGVAGSDAAAAHYQLGYDVGFEAACDEICDFVVSLKDRFL